MKLSERLILAVKEHGPHVIELTVCPKCGEESVHLHPFCESIQCECGTRFPSGVPRYRDEEVDGK